MLMSIHHFYFLYFYQAPSSDDSYASEDDESDDCSICNDWLVPLCEEHVDSGPEVQHNEPMTELPYGLHFDYAVCINATNEKKWMPLLLQLSQKHDGDFLGHQLML